MTEPEWIQCSDVEKMLNHLCLLFPEIEWTDRKVQLLVCACCRAVLNTLPSECQDLIQLIEVAADNPTKRHNFPGAFDRAEKAADLFGGDAPNFIFAIGYCDLGSACFDAARMVACAELDDHDDEFELKRTQELLRQANCARDIFGNPFHKMMVDPCWLTPEAVSLAQIIYEQRVFGRMTELADLLKIAGCNDDNILAHCFSSQEHVRGCWVIDVLLGKE